MQTAASREDAFQPGKITIAGDTKLEDWRKEGGASTVLLAGTIQASELKLGAQGLPVAGYKKTQPQWALDLVNENKVLEEKTLRQIDRHVAKGSELDQRAVALARTAIQDAFMWLNRGVFQPQRLQGDLE